MNKTIIFLFNALISIAVSGQHSVSELYEDWEGGEWMKFFKIVNTYDENDLKVQVMNQIWNDITHSFEDNEQINLFYDNFGNVDFTISQIYDQSLEEWINFSRTEYTYNENNKILESVFQHWGSNGWYDSGKIINSYNANGLLFETVHQIMNYDLQVYENFDRDLKNYTSQGVLDENINQFWNSLSQSWENRQQTIYEFNNGLETRATQNKWENDNWRNFERKETTYNGDDQILFILFESWDELANSYRHSGKNTAYYNHDGTLYQFVYESMNSGTWENRDRITYTYDNSVGIDDYFKSSNEIVVYPNPTNNLLYFSENVNVRLRNISGQLIATEDFVDVLDLSDQASGIYFLHFYTSFGDVLNTVKIIKE